MLARLPRLPALVLIVLALAWLGWAASLDFASKGPPAKTNMRRGELYGDVVLYRDIAREMMTGHGYYEAAANQQRTNGFPTRPFLSIRPPTLAWIETALGLPALRVVLPALLLGAMLAFIYALDGVGAFGEKVGAAAGLLFGGSLVACSRCLTLHELWAGTIAAIAIPLASRGRWPAALALAALALAIRELALPVLGIAGFWALVDGRRKEAAACAAVAVLWIAGMVAHAHFATLVERPTDLVSPGWLGLRGPRAVLADMARNSLFGAFDRPWAGLLAALPLIGWLGAPWRLARYALPVLLGWAALIAICARADNPYWAVLMLPLWCAGVAFVPRAIRDLVRAALARRPASTVP